jgi:hypothetical protein
MLNSDGTVKLWTPFITGFLQDNSYIGRPVDAADARPLAIDLGRLERGRLSAQLSDTHNPSR